MHVYFKNGDKQRWLIVELVEGHVPKVTDLSCDDTRSITENLEPAIWFKVMVLETINVDCFNRMVSWTNGMKGRDGNPVTNVIYGDGRSCYDFDDDIDELFKIGNFLIDKSPLSEANEDKRREQVIEYERCVIRILHCYILSKVIFQPCDLDCIRNALTTQQKSISQLEDNALVHSRLAEHYLAQMRNIRELEILPVLEQLIDGSLVSITFIDALTKDLKKIEGSLRREFDGAQDLVDKLKEQMKYGKSTQNSHDLECARRERNEAHRNLELHLLGKELCRMSRCPNINEADMNENCCRYLKLHRRVQTEKGISNLTIDKKLRAVSVRECIESVIRDLEKGQESSGDDITVDGQRVTDVRIHENCAPEWQTLTQRLSAIVYNKEHPVGIAFHNFCENLQSNYREVIRSLEYLANGYDNGMTTYEDFYIVSEKDYGLTKVFLENQRNLILSHIYQLTELLAEGFRNNWNMFVRKIRLCYEKCFYNRIGRELCLMYRLVYTKSMRTLEERINKLKALEICKLGLEMKSEWWLELFEASESNEVPYVNVEDDEVDGKRAWDGGYLSDVESEAGGDQVDFITDIGEEEYCEAPGSQYFGRQRSYDGMKSGLQVSKDKVLSRSCFDLCSAESSPSQSFIQMNSKLLEDEITEHGNEQRPRFDSEAAARLLNDDITLRRSSSPRLARWNSDTLKEKKRGNSMLPGDSFDVHFGQALKVIRNVFSNPSPLKKMQCLTAALKLISNKVEELRMREHDETDVDRAEVAVTAEDLLPLLVLVLLKLAAEDAAKLFVDLLFVSDLMADFLSSGCHSFALCEFQIAFRVLDQTCEELSI